MSDKDIAKELMHYLDLYAVGADESYLNGILTFAAMLAGRVSK